MKEKYEFVIIKEVSGLPIISQFYGILIKMFFNDMGKHHEKHIHAEYGEYTASFDFDGKLISGYLPNKQRVMVEAWINIHKEELEALWKALNEDNQYFKIEPLK